VIDCIGVYKPLFMGFNVIDQCMIPLMDILDDTGIEESHPPL